jgi:hypothetical protein
MMKQQQRPVLSHPFAVVPHAAQPFVSSRRPLYVASSSLTAAAMMMEERSSAHLRLLLFLLTLLRRRPHRCEHAWRAGESKETTSMALLLCLEKPQQLREMQKCSRDSPSRN